MDVYITHTSDIENRPHLTERYAALLSVDEKRRYRCMKSPSRCLQFLIGRALIQDVCHQSPDVLQTGKPLISDGFIGLSHAGPYVVLGVDDSPLGLDIENTARNKDFERLAARLNFTLTGEKRSSFYRQFTRYESTYKIGIPNRPLYHNYYSIDSFIICVSTLKKNEKINFYKNIPFVQNTAFTPPYLGLEVQNDL